MYATARHEINAQNETTVVPGTTLPTTFLPVGHPHFTFHLSPAGDEPEAQDEPAAAPSTAPSAAPSDVPSDAPEPEPMAAAEGPAAEPATAATTLEEDASPTEVTLAETEVVAEEHAPPAAATLVEDITLVAAEFSLALGEEEAVLIEPVVELVEAEEPATAEGMDAVVDEETEAKAAVDEGAAAEVAVVTEEEEATRAGDGSVVIVPLNVILQASGQTYA